MVHRCTIALVVLGVSAWASILPDTNNDVKIDKNDPVFLAPRKAKTLLRVRRWGIKRITGEEREEESESRERRNEAARRAQHAATCRASCWGGWGPWSACSKPCGASALRTSTRPVAPPGQCSGWVASNGCPGPGSRTEPCNRACQNGGTLRPNDCACPPGFTGQCCQTRVTCGYPGKPTNGNVSPVGSSHLFNTVARFTCNTGYRMNGTATRKCLNNGQWSHSVPTCEIVTCADPGTPANTARQGGDFRYDHSVLYTCNTGYSMTSGSSTRKCQANGQWAGVPPVCHVITCPASVSPSNGQVRLVSGQSNQHGSVAEFSCSPGHYLHGSKRRTCQLSGQWNGAQPNCTRIKCKALTSPAHGSVSQQLGSDQLVDFGAQAQFSCASGYRLRGQSTRTCGGAGPDGVWLGDQPSCEPVNCNNPGMPANGARSGSAFTFPMAVNYTCLPGYFMQGASSLACQANGDWSVPLPACSACPKNYHKAGANTLNECTACPENSHTVAGASSSPQLCICNVGYRGTPGGPCQQITCPAMPAPAHSSMAVCHNVYNSKCHFTCVDGYVQSEGSSTRQCRQDGQWSGAPVVCSPCPRDTYKSSETTCLQCPSMSRTEGEANMLEGCICEPGYQGPAGGPCQDVDECARNSGGCQQTCSNTIGSYRCRCTQAGYIQDMNDFKKCLSKNQCPAMEAPSNGGLVCLADAATNTERCEVKCNPGYEHITRTNAFESCGPATSWQWSFEVNDTPVLPCIEQFFEGVRVEAEVAYFINQCDQLTETIMHELKQNFVNMLYDQGVCIDTGTAVCDFADFSVSCGDVESFDELLRRKRSTSGVKELRIRFSIKVDKRPQSQVNCSNYCQDISTTDDLCKDICLKKHKITAFKTVQNATEKMRELFSDQVNFTSENRDMMRHGGASVTDDSATSRTTPRGTPPTRRALPSSTLRVGGLVLLPKRVVTASPPTADCGPGVESINDMCVPCPPGTYMARNMTNCTICPQATYQPDLQQTSCINCPTLRHSNQTGAVTCPTRTTTSSPTTRTPVEFIVNIRPNRRRPRPRPNSGSFLVHPVDQRRHRGRYDLDRSHVQSQQQVPNGSN